MDPQNVTNVMWAYARFRSPPGRDALEALDAAAERPAAATAGLRMAAGTPARADIIRSISKSKLRHDSARVALSAGVAALLGVLVIIHDDHSCRQQARCDCTHPPSPCDCTHPPSPTASMCGGSVGCACRRRSRSTRE